LRSEKYHRNLGRSFSDRLGEIKTIWTFTKVDVDHNSIRVKNSYRTFRICCIGCGLNLEACAI
jgi:hypothetical protein